ncbi:MAG TPA: manganese efflux pump MntP [Methylophilus sp.]|uniref:manganese efflux pump MntP n=1 Tax=Methylophilus sp. TaxID=29541 RepID=UPI002BF71BCD|nr:manganese efflux pump MntP [Methylophilus sp.]HSH87294.1 manganese efflux pump MntP [Methylophilus sp.]
MSIDFVPTRKLTMTLTTIALIALAMSTDAFAAAISKGATLKKPKLSEALRTGLIFGVIEAITPLIGWAIATFTIKNFAANYITDWDHWIAFTLLLALGLHMIYAGFQPAEPEEEKPTSHSFYILAITAFATSIDAMAVGVSLAFMDVNILITAAAIGFATFTMVTIGVMLGRVLGLMFGKRSEIVGGVVLIAIGSYILYEHLFSL